jgi:hypothetical protein
MKYEICLKYTTRYNSTRDTSFLISCWDIIIVYLENGKKCKHTVSEKESFDEECSELLGRKRLAKLQR